MTLTAEESTQKQLYWCANVHGDEIYTSGTEDRHERTEGVYHHEGADLVVIPSRSEHQSSLLRYHFSLDSNNCNWKQYRLGSTEFVVDKESEKLERARVDLIDDKYKTSCELIVEKDSFTIKYCVGTGSVNPGTSISRHYFVTFTKDGRGLTLNLKVTEQNTRTDSFVSNHKVLGNSYSAKIPQGTHLSDAFEPLTRDFAAFGADDRVAANFFHLVAAKDIALWVNNIASAEDYLKPSDKSRAVEAMTAFVPQLGGQRSGV